jgi:hypothetical protein
MIKSNKWDWWGIWEIKSMYRIGTEIMEGRYVWEDIDIDGKLTWKCILQK